MFNPRRRRPARLARALGEQRLRGICLFPAMHGYRLDDERVEGGVRGRGGARRGGVRPLRRADGRRPQEARAAVALRSPARRSARARGGCLALSAACRSSSRTSAPGFFREALMAADQCPTIHLDTSSSNGWMKYYPGLTLEDVFRRRSPSPARHGCCSAPTRRSSRAAGSSRSTTAQDGALRSLGGRAMSDRARSSAAISIGCFRRDVDARLKRRATSPQELVD